MSGTTRPRLTVEPRLISGRKSDIRALRRAGNVPGSLFGHGEPQVFSIPARTLGDFMRQHAQGGLLDLEIGGKVTPALIREVDRHPITGQVIQIGLQRVDMAETLKASITIQFTGEEQLIEQGFVLERQADDLEVQGRADLLPETLIVDVSALTPGDSVRVADLPLPAGVETARDPELTVARVSSPKVAADVAAALDEEEAAHAALHPEDGGTGEPEAAPAG